MSLLWCSDDQPSGHRQGCRVPESRKGHTVAAQRNGNPSTQEPSYLRAAEVADILHVSPKTVSRWAKEGKLPFMKTLGGHRRYPAAKIRDLAEQLREEPTA
jgi:excisionase family DNA binding protein